MQDYVPIVGATALGHAPEEPKAKDAPREKALELLTAVLAALKEEEFAALVDEFRASTISAPSTDAALAPECAQPVAGGAATTAPRPTALPGEVRDSRPVGRHTNNVRGPHLVTEAR